MTALAQEAPVQTSALTMSASRDELADALTYVGALAISSRRVLPILGGVKITAASGVATVEAFDYETHAVQVITATGEGCALLTGTGFVTFSDGTRTVTARTLDGEFPKYKSLMPDAYTATLVVDAKRAVKATKRAALVCTRTSPVVVQLDSDGATITAGKDYDDARASVPAGGDYTGEAMSVGVNPAYLLDMLAGVGSDSVTIGFTASVKPFVAWDAERPALRWLQMPVRLS